MIVDLECVSCGKSNTLDLRYFYTTNINSYELEYHCSTLHGGCNFYRIISLMHAHEDPHQNKLGDEESKIKQRGGINDNPLSSL